MSPLGDPWTQPQIELPPAADYAMRIRHRVVPGWHQDYLLMADAHWDSPECALKLLHLHLREAWNRRALVIDAGDWFDVIAGQNDRRGTKGSLREEHSGINYLDRLVDDAVDEFAEYAELFAYMGTGNHETSVLVRKETDLTRRLVERLNGLRRPGVGQIYRAGYTGWIRFMFESESGTQRTSHAMKIEHGLGADSPVTKGVIQVSRRAARTEGATFFVSGHIHEQFDVPNIVERLNPTTSRVEQHKTSHLQLGSYKLDYRTDGVATWAMMKMGRPKPIGGKWLRFWSDNGRDVKWQVTDTDVDYARLNDYLPRTRVEKDSKVLIAS